MSESLSNLTLTSEVQCHHCAAFNLECVPHRVHNFFTEFKQKMLIVVNNRVMNSSSTRLGSVLLQIDPPTVKKETVMRMEPSQRLSKLGSL